MGVYMYDILGLPLSSSSPSTSPQHARRPARSHPCLPGRMTDTKFMFMIMIISVITITIIIITSIITIISLYNIYRIIHTHASQAA